MWRDGSGCVGGCYEGLLGQGVEVSEGGFLDSTTRVCFFLDMEWMLPWIL